MAELNEKLLKSFVSDLHEADKVTRSIISYVGEIKTYSWKFPSSHGDTIDSIKLIKEFSGSQEEHYHFITELLVDRYIL